MPLCEPPCSDGFSAARPVSPWHSTGAAVYQRAMCPEMPGQSTGVPNGSRASQPRKAIAPENVAAYADEESFGSSGACFICSDPRARGSAVSVGTLSCYGRRRVLWRRSRSVSWPRRCLNCNGTRLLEVPADEHGSMMIGEEATGRRSYGNSRRFRRHDK